MNSEEFVQEVEQGLLGENDIVMFIMENLIHPSQASWMRGQGLEIRDLLNGRFNVKQAPTVGAIFADWNLKLGKTIFRGV